MGKEATNTITLFPQLLPQLLKGMVHPPGNVEELMEANAINEQRYIVKGQHDSDDDSEDSDNNDVPEGDDKGWTL